MNEQDKAFAARYDTFGNEWQDMGADQYFAAGWQAALEYARGQQEPVAWVNYNPTDGSKWYSDMQENIDSEPLYTHPAQPVQPAVAVNEHELKIEIFTSLLGAMEEPIGERFDGKTVRRNLHDLLGWVHEQRDELIAAAEAAKGGV